MTLIVGALCSDGVVIGADSSATSATGQQQATIESKGYKKVHVVGEDVVFATSGEVGLAQRFQTELEGAHKSGTFNRKTTSEIADHVCQRTVKNFMETSAHVLGTSVPKVGIGGLLGFHAKQDGFSLVEFAYGSFQPQAGTPEMWFAAMGSGQYIADPFLAFLKRVFFHDRQPKLIEGIFVTLWTLEQAIAVNPGGIDGPAMISTLSLIDGKPEARELSEDEMVEHGDAIEGVEKHISGYRDQLGGSSEGAEAIPEPPSTE